MVWNESNALNQQYLRTAYSQNISTRADAHSKLSSASDVRKCVCECVCVPPFLEVILLLAVISMPVPMPMPPNASGVRVWSRLLCGATSPRVEVEESRCGSAVQSDDALLLSICSVSSNNLINGCSSISVIFVCYLIAAEKNRSV